MTVSRVTGSGACTACKALDLMTWIFQFWLVLLGVATASPDSLAINSINTFLPWYLFINPTLTKHVAEPSILIPSFPDIPSQFWLLVQTFQRPFHPNLAQVKIFHFVTPWTSLSVLHPHYGRIHHPSIIFESRITFCYTQVGVWWEKPTHRFPRLVLIQPAFRSIMLWQKLKPLPPFAMKFKPSVMKINSFMNVLPPSKTNDLEPRILPPHPFPHRQLLHRPRSKNPRSPNPLHSMKRHRNSPPSFNSASSLSAWSPLPSESTTMNLALLSFFRFFVTPPPNGVKLCLNLTPHCSLTMMLSSNGSLFSTKTESVAPNSRTNFRAWNSPVLLLPSPPNSLVFVKSSDIPSICIWETFDWNLNPLFEHPWACSLPPITFTI